MTLSDLKSIFGEGSVLAGFGFPLPVAGIASAARRINPSTAIETSRTSRLPPSSPRYSATWIT